MTKANVDVNSLTSLEDIQAAYDALSTEEETVVEELDSIVSSGFNLDQRLVTIANMVPDLDRVSGDCSQLDHRISVTCGLAGSWTWPRPGGRSVSRGSTTSST